MTGSVTLQSARQAIADRFLAIWDPSDAVVALENEAFVPPVDGSPWVRLSVRHHVAQQWTLGATGSRDFRRYGSIFVQCFSPRDRGTDAGDELASKVQTIFEGAVFDDVRCYATSIVEIGNDGKWWQVNAVTEFQYDETK